MFNSTDTNNEAYETIIGNTTFQVITKYTGDKPFLDFIKAAVKRDVEIIIQNDKKELDF
ncbi:MAG: hypothetical protein LBH74_00760 [Nitrososphaerota archaeon]|nr:hypothetical protein [Nitrososphaerota archaeon]